MGSLIMNILCTTVPLTILLFNYPSHLLGVFSMVFTYFMYLQRFILMMHYAEHRKLFKEPYHSVLQYLLPNLNAMNYILFDSLDGGGSESLINDAQGKTHGQAALLLELDLPQKLEKYVKT